jgi:hypothetical protein
VDLIWEVYQDLAGGIGEPAAGGDTDDSVSCHWLRSLSGDSLSRHSLWLVDCTVRPREEGLGREQGEATLPPPMAIVGPGL